MRLDHWRTMIAVVALLTAGGCSSVPQGDRTVERDPKDPLERYNRAVYDFNSNVDRAVLKPIASGYRAVTPEPVDRGVTNVFNNIADVTSAVNNLLQFKVSRFGSDVGRVAVNSTVGLLGVIDVASNMGLPNYKEDFGQTLGYWGAETSPYLVLPLLGPSTLRDSIGRAGDWFTNPLINLREKEIYWGLLALDVVDTRADLIPADELLGAAAVDPYTFVRDAYLQRRRSQINDGMVAEPGLEDDFFWEEDSPAKSSADEG